jgi:hypothetical protein
MVIHDPTDAQGRKNKDYRQEGEDNGPSAVPKDSAKGPSDHAKTVAGSSVLFHPVSFSFFFLGVPRLVVTGYRTLALSVPPTARVRLCGDAVNTV